jgi:hypothetical protein
MAYQNIPFSVALQQYHDLQHQPSFPTPAKTLTNFPALSSSPTLNTSAPLPDQTHPSYSKVLEARPLNNHTPYAASHPTQPKPSTGNTHLAQVKKLETILRTIPDSISLWNRIWKAIDLHIQFSHGHEPQRSQNPTVELSKP